VAHVERQVEAGAGHFDEARNCGEIVVQPGFVLDQHLAGEAFGEVLLQCVGIGADQDGADADPAARRQDVTDWGLADGVGDGVEGVVRRRCGHLSLHEVHCLHSFVCARTLAMRCPSLTPVLVFKLKSQDLG
jgi:hypothetical protein